jgi:uncharacterized membrane protein HdeD (DUF308 family)
MSSEHVDEMGMGGNSWILGVRGVVAILLGLYALLVPGLAVVTLILAFGVGILLEGILSIVAAVRVHDHDRRFAPRVAPVTVAQSARLGRWPPQGPDATATSYFSIAKSSTSKI